MNRNPSEVFGYEITDEIVNWVFKTCDYAKFDFHPLNRDIKEKRKKLISEQIEKKNLSADHPLTVVRDEVTGKLWIIEGQGRFTVNRDKGEPIHYKHSLEMTIEDVSFVGKLPEGWLKDEQLQFWCKKKNPHYLTLQNFLDAYPWLGLTTAAQLIGKGNMGGKEFTAAFNEGKFNSGNLSFGLKVAQQVQDYGEWYDFYKDARFVAVLRAVMKDPNYDHERMLGKLENFHSLMTKQAKAGGYYDGINAIYNYKTQEKNRYFFKKPKRVRGTEDK